MDLTRRQVVTAAGCLVCSALVAEALLRRRTDEFKSTMTTLFWVGEPSDADNAFIANDVSYWDKEWQLSYGGVDDPLHRNGYCLLISGPRRIPFMWRCRSASLNQLEAIILSPTLKMSPGTSRYFPPPEKSRVEIKLGDRTCYAQWQDVGPGEVDDFAFVFGDAKNPRNSFDAKAGLDVSPAEWHHLGMNNNEFTAWRFSNAADVPPGPWTEIVTTSGNNYFI